jgi:hypothetical protein
MALQMNDQMAVVTMLAIFAGMMILSQIVERRKK